MPRPKLPKTARRVSINARVAPATITTITAVARKLGGQGEAIDHIIESRDDMIALLKRCDVETSVAAEDLKKSDDPSDIDLADTLRDLNATIRRTITEAK